MLEGKKIGLLIGERAGECAVEITEIIRALTYMTARIHIISSIKQMKFPFQSGSLKADIPVTKARPEDFDAIILSCDCADPNSPEHTICLDFLKSIYRQGKPIGFFGKGAKLVTKLKLAAEIGTVTPNEESQADQTVIKQGNLIIARDTVTLVKFIEAMAGAVR
jgi:hypothetical protein